MKKKKEIKSKKKSANQKPKMQTRTAARVARRSKNDLPGYPHYPVKEDLLNAAPEERVDVDVEKLTSEGKGITNAQVKNLLETTQQDDPLSKTDVDIELVAGTDADVTEEDLQALGDKILDLDGGDDEKFLSQAKIGPDLSGDDLDIPGSTPDNASAEEAGSEDEENKYYSRGQE